MKKFDLDDEILKLYEEYESARPVAEQLGCSNKTVYRVLQKYNVPRKHRHPKPEKPKRKLVEIDVAEAVRMYYCGMGAPKIAEEFGCSAQAVRVRLIDAGVEFRNGGSPKCEVDTDEIRRLYLAGMNQKDIAERMGVSIFVVSRRIRQLGLSQKKKRRNIPLPMDEVVARFEAGETLDELANAFGCSRETVKRRLKAAGFEFATLSDLWPISAEEREVEFVKRLSQVPGGEKYEYVGGFSSLKGKVTIRCKSCGAVSEYIARGLLDKRHGIHECPECLRIEKEREKERRKEEREHELAKDKHCEVCGAVFHSEQKGARYCSKKCREKRYDSSHRKRARLFNVGYDGSISWRSLSERLGHCNCEICGKPCDPTDNSWGGNVGPLYPSVDCIVPMSKGGSYTWDNVQLAHCICNSAKRDLTSEIEIKEAVGSAKDDGRDGERHALGAAENAGLGHRSVNRCWGREPQHGAAGAAVPRDDTRDSRAAGGIR